MNSAYKYLTKLNVANNTIQSMEGLRYKKVKNWETKKKGRKLARRNEIGGELVKSNETTFNEQRLTLFFSSLHPFDMILPIDKIQ